MMAPSPDLAAHIARDGRAAHPHIEVAAEALTVWVDAHADAEADTLRAADVYLAIACVARLPAALEVFERDLAPVIPQALGRLDLTAAQRQDIGQQVRHKLLYADPPRVARYAGRGGLDAWVRVVAIRAGHDALRRARKEVLEDDDARLVDAHVEYADAELAFLKHRYRETLQEAMRAAFAALDPKARNLLRYSYVDGLNVDALGRLHGVHRATAARWVASARASLLQEARRELRARLGVDSAELDSVVRLLQSQLDVSLSLLHAR